MSARVTWSGLEEFYAALRNLPEELAGEAANIVEATTNSATVAVKSAYPVRTGNLRDHVTNDLQRSGLAVRGRVKNTARHAWLFENGSQARHTAIGANRGTMPPGHVFVPIIIRERRKMYDVLRDLLVRKGLLVSGEP